MSNRTALRMRVLPRFPARISATNGLKVVQDNLDLVVQPDFGALTQVPSVSNPNTTFFWGWDQSLDMYSSISFQNLVENIQDVIIGPTTAAMEATSPAADQFIYFNGPDSAAVTGLTAAGRALLDDANAAAQRTTLGLGTSAILNVGTTAATVAAGDDSRITGAAQKSSNLSDLANVSTARDNLGLGSAAVASASSFATAAQGVKADSSALLLQGMTTVFPYTFETRRFTNIGLEIIYGALTGLPFGHAALHTKANGARNAALFESVQDSASGDWSFPSAVAAYSSMESIGNQAFGIFGRVDLRTAGVATHELNTFNYSAGPPGTFPPNRAFGTTSSLGITLTLAAGGTYQSLIACEIGREGSEPNSYVCGIYTNPNGITDFGLVIDADATQGPKNSAVLNNTGQGTNVHLQFQTKGTAQASNFVAQHLNASGSRTWGITQDGAYFIGATKILDNDAWISFTPTVTATSGTITTLGTLTGKYKRVGRTVFVDVDVVITTNGTGAGQIVVGNMPVASSRTVAAFFGRESALSNKTIHGSMAASGSTITVFDYAGAYPAASGARLLLSGRYEV